MLKGGLQVMHASLLITGLQAKLFQKIRYLPQGKAKEKNEYKFKRDWGRTKEEGIKEKATRARN